MNGPILTPSEPGPGQFGGVLGRGYDPLDLGDVTGGTSLLTGMSLRPDLFSVRLGERSELVNRLEAGTHAGERLPATDGQRAMVNRGGLEYTSRVALLCRSAANLDDPSGSRGIVSRQANILRDIFGNPFRPISFDPRCQTSDVVDVARGLYADKAFERMPILSDALMDAGCEDEQIIGHCRGEGPHVRGCWVVDLILGRE